MKIVTGLTPTVRKWVLPAGSAHITLGGVTLALPTSVAGATLGDRVDLWVLHFSTTEDTGAARRGTAVSFTLLGSEPVIEKRGVEFELPPTGIPAFVADYEAHVRRQHNVPEDAVAVTEPSMLPFGEGLRRLRWFEVTL